MSVLLSTLAVIAATGILSYLLSRFAPRVMAMTLALLMVGIGLSLDLFVGFYKPEAWGWIIFEFGRLLAAVPLEAIGLLFGLIGGSWFGVKAAWAEG